MGPGMAFTDLHVLAGSSIISGPQSPEREVPPQSGVPEESSQAASDSDEASAALAVKAEIVAEAAAASAEEAAAAAFACTSQGDRPESQRSCRALVLAPRPLGLHPARRSSWNAGQPGYASPSLSLNTTSASSACAASPVTAPSAARSSAESRRDSPAESRSPPEPVALQEAAAGLRLNAARLHERLAAQMEEMLAMQGEEGASRDDALSCRRLEEEVASESLRMLRAAEMTRGTSSSSTSQPPVPPPVMPPPPCERWFARPIEAGCRQDEELRRVQARHRQAEALAVARAAECVHKDEEILSWRRRCEVAEEAITAAELSASVRNVVSVMRGPPSEMELPNTVSWDCQCGPPAAVGSSQPTVQNALAAELSALVSEAEEEDALLQAAGLLSPTPRERRKEADHIRWLREEVRNLTLQNQQVTLRLESSDALCDHLEDELAALRQRCAAAEKAANLTVWVRRQ